MPPSSCKDFHGPPFQMRKVRLVEAAAHPSLSPSPAPPLPGVKTGEAARITLLSCFKGLPCLPTSSLSLLGLGRSWGMTLVFEAELLALHLP